MSYQVSSLKQETLDNDIRVTRISELDYLSNMLPQLRKMALSLGEDTLARLLEISMLEAQLQYDIAKMEFEKR